jgi:PAS domain S-box-containing protein
MTTSERNPESAPPASTAEQVSDLFDALDVSKAIDTGEFRLFLDHLPIAIVISKLIKGEQCIVFANKAYESITGQPVGQIVGRRWRVLDSFTLEDDANRRFSDLILAEEDFAGTFRRDQPKPITVEAYAGRVENEDGTEAYRIVALIDVTQRERAQREEFARQMRDKDMLLKEIQHRVKNNLQLITALIRIDARNHRQGDTLDLNRLAGRVESLQILYRDLSADGFGQTVDLGHYLSEIASSVMHTFAVDGIRLDLKVDVSPASINVAMPIGLLVNEVLTNSFKYAFKGTGKGTITIRCLQEDETTYRIVVADDGVGLPEGETWPPSGKLGALILQTLTENAETEFSLETAPGKGTRVTLKVKRKPAAGRKAN